MRLSCVFAQIIIKPSWLMKKTYWGLGYQWWRASWNILDLVLPVINNVNVIRAGESCVVTDMLVHKKTSKLDQRAEMTGIYPYQHHTCKSREGAVHYHHLYSVSGGSTPCDITSQYEGGREGGRERTSQYEGGEGGREGGRKQVSMREGGREKTSQYEGEREKAFHKL